MGMKHFTFLMLNDSLIEQKHAIRGHGKIYGVWKCNPLYYEYDVKEVILLFMIVFD
jgi:hypothetical protein